MMKKHWILIAGILALGVAACEKSDLSSVSLGEGTSIAEEEVFALKASESIDSDVDAAKFGATMFTGPMGIGGHHHFFGIHFPDCATVTSSGDEFPKQIVIDYGEGCSGRFGMGRTGTVTIDMSDTITVEGAVYTITFDSVTIGNHQIDKTATLTNEGINADGNQVFSYTSDATITKVMGDSTVVINRDFSGQIEWISGFGTPEIEDDQFYRTAEGTIVVDGELVFNRTTLTPVFIDRSCMYPLSGVVQITRDGEEMIIDFGDGECDNVATVTKDGVTEEIELERGKFHEGFDRGHRHMKKKKGWW